MKASEVFQQNNGDVTKSYYALLNGMGSTGELAVALFRAQKRSTAAKKYRGGKYRSAAYDVKNWSLSEICRVLQVHGLDYTWGWKRDPLTPGFEWVLYVDLPTGQCSFHSADRLSGQDYPLRWDGGRGSEAAILKFCDLVYENHVSRNVVGPKPKGSEPTA